MSKVYISPVAGSIPFDNDTNGFSSDDVQAAIEEAKTSGVGAVIPFHFVSSGNTSDKWLGYVNSAAPSNSIPFIVPQNADVKGISFSNRDDDVDINIQIFINGTEEHEEQVRNKRWYYRFGISGAPSPLQGDRISVFLEKYTGGTGDSTAQDPIITIYLKFTNEAAGTGGAQTGVT